MYRNIAYCLTKGYSAKDYANYHSKDLYDDLSKSANTDLVDRYNVIPENIRKNLTIPEKLEASLKKLCYTAYANMYERYQLELETLILDSEDKWEDDEDAYEAELETLILDFDGNFHEHEIDRFVQDFDKAVLSEFVQQFEGKSNDKKGKV